MVVGKMHRECGEVAQVFPMTQECNQLLMIHADFINNYPPCVLYL